MKKLILCALASVFAAQAHATTTLTCTQANNAYFDGKFTVTLQVDRENFLTSATYQYGNANAVTSHNVPADLNYKPKANGPYVNFQRFKLDGDQTCGVYFLVIPKTLSTATSATVMAAGCEGGGTSVFLTCKNGM